MINIGIADDDALVRQTLRELLSKYDDIAVSWIAKDGQEALDLFHSSEVESTVQAVLVDVQMPKMDGLALAKALLDYGQTVLPSPRSPSRSRLKHSRAFLHSPMGSPSQNENGRY